MDSFQSNWQGFLHNNLKYFETFVKFIAQAMIPPIQKEIKIQNFCLSRYYVPVL